MAAETTPLAEQIDTIVPKAQNFEVELPVPGDEPIRLVEKPLSFFGKLELVEVLSRALDETLTDGGTEFSVMGLLAARQTGDAKLSEMVSADVFTKLLLKLGTRNRDILLEVYCIALGVQKGQREFVSWLMSRPEDEGGLSDEVGVKVLETFIDQNWDALVDFFEQRILPMVERIAKRGTPSQS